MLRLNQLLDLPHVDLTYIGIGTCYHRPIEHLDDITDQIVPLFVKREKGSIRIIHFDPLLTVEKMNEYFTHKCIPMDYMGCCDGVHNWRGTIDCYAIFEEFSHTDNYDWLVRFCNKHSYDNKNIVLQEFTGRNMNDLFLKIYNACNKDLFKRNILFDVSYGESPGCGTDMSKYAPIYGADGYMLNFMLMDDEEITSYIGLRDDCDRFIKNHFIRRYENDLNNLHVDYRRRICGGDEYKSNLDADVIMETLQKRLRFYINILQIYDSVTTTSVDELFNNYREYDMYKWYSFVLKIIKKDPVQ